ncbi:MAG TPA: CAP domain-containing protein [Acidimicrobiales bacterium]|nr:CAP domain-containing protein [Acidimicrobiales bacterium]
MERASSAALAAGLVTGLLVGSTTVTGSPASAATPAVQYGRAAFDATNDQRVRHDRRRLQRGDCLRDFAARHARRMAAREEIWHQDLQRVLEVCDLSWAGENVAAGFPSGRAVVKDGWMDSKSHRENLLARKFRRMSVVAREGDDGRWYVSQVLGRTA